MNSKKSYCYFDKKCKNFMQMEQITASRGALLYDRIFKALWLNWTRCIFLVTKLLLSDPTVTQKSLNWQNWSKIAKIPGPKKFFCLMFQFINMNNDKSFVKKSKTWKIYCVLSALKVARVLYSWSGSKDLNCVSLYIRQVTLHSIS